MKLALIPSTGIGLTFSSIHLFARVPESLHIVSSSKTISQKGIVKNTPKDKFTDILTDEETLSDSTSSPNRVVCQRVEESAEFPGGTAGMIRYLSSSIVYPEYEQKNDIQGRVIVKIIIESDGSIMEPKILKGVSPGLDKEALRVVNEMPKWTPGKINGVAVASYFTLPVTFRLPIQ